MQTMTATPASLRPRQSSASNPYSDNAFRLLGLGVTASEREVRGRSKELVLAAELGMSDPGQGERIRRAAAALEDPVSRLREEVYWLHLTPTPVSATIDLADAKALSSAKRSLAILAKQGSDEAAHDLAVLAHASIIEAGIDEAARWKVAVVRWHQVWASEPFWLRVSLRAEALGDPRATNAAVQALRAELPLRILLPTSSLVARLLEEENDPAAARHLAIVSKSNFPLEVVERIRSSATEGLRSRIRAGVAEIQEHLEVAERSGNNPAANLRPALVEAWTTFRSEVVPLVERLPNIDRYGTEARVLADTAAEFAQSLGVRFHNKADDSAAGIAPLEAAVRLAASESVRQRAADNLQIVRFSAAMASAYKDAQLKDWKSAMASAQVARGVATSDEQRRTAQEFIGRCQILLQRRTRTRIGWAIAGAVVALIIGYSAFASGNSTNQPAGAGLPASAPSSAVGSCLPGKLALGAETDSLKTDLNSLQSQISAVNARMDLYSRQGNVGGYNSLVPMQNSLVNSYEAKRAQYNTLVDQYNAMSC